MTKIYRYLPLDELIFATVFLEKKPMRFRG